MSTITESVTDNAVDKATLDKMPQIWNPNAAVNWSLLFTPVFGTYFQYRNWITLNEPERAKTTRIWLILSCCFLAFRVASAFNFIILTESLFIPLFGGFVVYFFTWYFLDGRTQNTYMKEKYQGMYRRKSWKIPLLIAIPIFYVVTVVDWHNHPMSITSDSAEVKLVKNGYLDECQEYTVDQIITHFMHNPTWESGKAIDGDVKGKDIVNIRGKISYHDKPVEAVMQFVVEGSSFTLQAIEYNGVPQPALMATGLIMKMCESVPANMSVTAPLTQVPSPVFEPVVQAPVDKEFTIVGTVVYSNGETTIGSIKSIDEIESYTFTLDTEAGEKIIQACHEATGDGIYCKIEGIVSNDNNIASVISAEIEIREYSNAFSTQTNVVTPASNTKIYNTKELESFLNKMTLIEKKNIINKISTYPEKTVFDICYEKYSSIEKRDGCALSLTADTNLWEKSRRIYMLKTLNEIVCHSNFSQDSLEVIPQELQSQDSKNIFCGFSHERLTNLAKGQSAKSCPEYMMTVNHPLIKANKSPLTLFQILVEPNNAEIRLGGVLENFQGNRYILRQGDLDQEILVNAMFNQPTDKKHVIAEVGSNTKKFLNNKLVIGSGIGIYGIYRRNELNYSTEKQLPVIETLCIEN
ncbi:hypothetical protein [Sterolibacterium denitrificans]|uniref:hypothetical protein n=1 Tax=Sterolibacterium denitrificans TaxID=157592 RepID=UPI0012B6922F|nr:hypothetical protein [Sterolibacterium denitrificans]